MPSTELEKHPVPEVDPHDEPSAEWGWHGTFKFGARIWGWFVVIACLGMLIGNQQGHTEDLYLVLTAALTLLILLLNMRKRRTAWRK